MLLEDCDVPSAAVGEGQRWQYGVYLRMGGSLRDGMWGIKKGGRKKEKEGERRKSREGGARDRGEIYTAYKCVTSGHGYGDGVVIAVVHNTHHMDSFTPSIFIYPRPRLLNRTGSTSFIPSNCEITNVAIHSRSALSIPTPRAEEGKSNKNKKRA